MTTNTTNRINRNRWILSIIRLGFLSIYSKIKIDKFEENRWWKLIRILSSSSFFYFYCILLLNGVIFFSKLFDLKFGTSSTFAQMILRDSMGYQLVVMCVCVCKVISSLKGDSILSHAFSLMFYRLCKYVCKEKKYKFCNNCIGRTIRRNPICDILRFAYWIFEHIYL